MKTIGHRKQQPITFSASAELLAEGARFNDELHSLPTGNTTCVPKGVFCFKTHEDANRHWQACVVESVARTVSKRT